MGLWERLQYAFVSPLGVVFFGLLLFLSLLMLIYWVLAIRQRRQDYYVYQHQIYYQKALSKVKDLKSMGSHQTDFFGRQTVVQFLDGSFGHCLIPPPELAKAAMRDRYRLVQQAVQAYGDVIDDEQLVILQKGTLRSDGLPLLNMKQILTDKRLVVSEREQLLFKVARRLRDLHQRLDSSGQPLYHGFLLPRNLLVNVDSDHQIQEVVVPNAGLAYVFGAEQICSRLTLLRTGQLPIDRFCANELLEQMPFLAPEQRSHTRLAEVGHPVDYYAFGAIALSLFGHKRFSSVKESDWTSVPEKWQPFLRACLEDLPANRPQDFLEIEAWLSDPELALIYTEAALSDAQASKLDQDREKEAENELSALTGLLRQNEAVSHKEPHALAQHLEAGQQAINSAKWESAKKALKTALRIDPNNVTANLNLAIALYELGEIKDSEKHVKSAAAIDPSAAKRFRQHIVFRL